MKNLTGFEVLQIGNTEHDQPCRPSGWITPRVERWLERGRPFSATRELICKTHVMDVDGNFVVVIEPHTVFDMHSKQYELPPEVVKAVGGFVVPWCFRRAGGREDPSIYFLGVFVEQMDVDVMCKCTRVSVRVVFFYQRCGTIRSFVNCHLQFATVATWVSPQG